MGARVGGPFGGTRIPCVVPVPEAGRARGARHIVVRSEAWKGVCWAADQVSMQRRVGPALILWFLASLTLLACSGQSQHASGDGDDGSGASGDIIDFYRAIFEAECEFLDRCAAEKGPAYVNTAACLENLDYVLVTLQYAAERLEGGFPYEVHPAHESACIEALFPKDSCDEPTLGRRARRARRARTSARAIGISTVSRSAAAGTASRAPKTFRTATSARAATHARAARAAPTTRA
jgi:hypothetical protein